MIVLWNTIYENYDVGLCGIHDFTRHFSISEHTFLLYFFRPSTNLSPIQVRCIIYIYVILFTDTFGEEKIYILTTSINDIPNVNVYNNK